ncbi:molecular chaperone [Scandinavium goeteborgense]|uniref:fimbrial biogenesis chaperone n=1 Tax=Scandinavium goeteborgense TaxID=1851514 RepID=UPI00381732D7
MKFKTLTLLGLVVATLNTAHAGIVVGGTRVIYDATKKEAALNLTNPDNTPYLVQSWVNNSDDSNNKPPFIITPPLFRLDGNQQNVLRIVQAGTLPQDHESMFWLNVKSIPSTAKAISANTLQIAVKTQIKLIYRPTALKGSSAEREAGKLTWKRDGSNIQVTNPTNYYMNFNNIKLNGVDLKGVTYAAPHSSAEFPLPQGSSAGNLSFGLISDYGSAGEQHSATF